MNIWNWKMLEKRDNILLYGLYILLECLWALLVSMTRQHHHTQINDNNYEQLYFIYIHILYYLKTENQRF